MVYLKNNTGVAPGMLVQAKYWQWGKRASLYGVSSRMSFDAWITLVEPYMAIMWVYWTHVIRLIITDYTVQFGQDSSLAHPLLHTDEYMVRLAIPINHVSVTITAPSQYKFNHNHKLNSVN